VTVLRANMWAPRSAVNEREKPRIQNLAT